LYGAEIALKQLFVDIDVDGASGVEATGVDCEHVDRLIDRLGRGMMICCARHHARRA
jgi:hypothetical protein